MGRALLRVAGFEHNFRADATARWSRRWHPSPAHIGRSRGGERAPRPSHRVLPCTHLPFRIIAVIKYKLASASIPRSAAPGCSEREQSETTNNRYLARCGDRLHVDLALRGICDATRPLRARVQRWVPTSTRTRLVWPTLGATRPSLGMHRQPSSGTYGRRRAKIVRIARPPIVATFSVVETGCMAMMRSLAMPDHRAPG